MAESKGRFATVNDVVDTVYSVTHMMKAATGQNIIVDSGQLISKR